MTRTAGKLGRRAPKRAPALKLAKYLTGTLPVVPAGEDYLAALHGGWQMLGNDQAGDCVAVTWANFRRLVTSTLTVMPSYPSEAQVWSVYQSQNPLFNPNGGAETGPGSQYDQGMDIQTVLEWLVNVGGPDGVKAVGFASVNVQDPAEVKAAIALFGAVWTGINVLSVNMQQFADERPFDYVAGSPVDGGHSVLTGGYGTPGIGVLAGDERFITWAQETSFTDTFWENCVEEAWVVIWPEHLANAEFLAGVDMAQLAADYTALTGEPFPAALTPPKPAAPVTAAPVTPPVTLIAELIEKMEQFVTWLKKLV
jgi:hypothetical protein